MGQRQQVGTDGPGASMKAAYSLSRGGRVLAVVNLALFGLIVFRFIAPGPSLPRVVAPPGRDASATGPVDDPAAPSLAVVARMMEQRQLFGFPGQTTADPAPAGGHEPVAAPRGNLLEQYRLAGIILDDQPRAVVIGPGPEGPTLFLSIGDPLNGAILKDVAEKKAIFDLQGQRLELTIQ